jgi:phenylacetate-CoA ligase
MTTSLLRRIAKSIAVKVEEPWMSVVCDLYILLNSPHRNRTRQLRNFLDESEHWSAERLSEFQWTKLKEILKQAYTYVPHYRKVFHQLGAVPEDIVSFSDYRKLPLLSKQEVRDHLREFVAENIPKSRRSYVTTGGSTGTPVGFFFDKGVSDALEWAFITTLWRRVGYKPGDRTAVFRGGVVSNGKLWEAAPLQNSIIFSSYHLTEDRLPVYLERMRKLRPRYIQAYPSSISIVAQFMLEKRLPPVEGIRAVLCGSENLYPEQRKLIEEAFQCRVYSWYGQAEKVCLAGECEYDSKLHVFPEYGVTELIDQNGEAITAPGKVGEIVATGFLSMSMPLIRYKTNDLAVWAEGYCKKCGRQYPMFERIEGRLQEFIVTGTNRLISMTAINMHSPVFDNVRQFRFYQEVPGKVILRIVPKGSYNREYDDMQITSELMKKLGDDVSLEIEVVSEIPRTVSGKHRFLDQRLPIQLKGTFTTAVDHSIFSLNVLHDKNGDAD